MGIGEGLTFELINALPDRHIGVLCPIGRKMNMERVHAQKTDISICYGNLLQDKENIDVLDFVKGKIEEYGYLVVDIDRWYLDYLTCDKAHVGFHQIVVCGYHDDEQTFDVIDALMDLKPVSLSYEEFKQGVFSKHVLSMGGEYYYFPKHIYKKEISTILVKEALLNAAHEMVYAQRVKAQSIISRLVDYEKVQKENEKVRQYIKMQKDLLLNSLFEQDRGHCFYRKIFLNFIEQNSTIKSKIMFTNIQKDYQMFFENLYKDFITSNSSRIIMKLNKLMEIDNKLGTLILERNEE